MGLYSAYKIVKYGSKLIFRKKKHANKKDKKARKKLRLRTKVALGAAAVGTVAVGTAAAVVLARENSVLTPKAYTVGCKGLPAAFDGMRIVHLSDLHSATFGKNQARLLSMVDTLKPDMVLITGDLIDRRRTVKPDDMIPALTLLQQLQKRVPTIRVEGNHEAVSPVGVQFKAYADRTGAQNVTGRSLPITRGEDTVHVIGIPDIASVQYEEDIWRENLHELCAAHADTFRIVLSHRPQYVNDYANEDLPLVLCGHAHGGQVRLPLIGGLYAPEQGVLPRYTAGKHTQNNTTMIVSRGLGNSGFPLRFGNRPEVGVITLKAID